MAKIQVSTVKMTADVEVINVSSYLVAKVVRAQMHADQIIEANKHVKTEWDEEAREYKPVLDDNGREQYEYADITTHVVEDHIYPLLNELVEAFGVKDNRI